MLGRLAPSIRRAAGLGQVNGDVRKQNDHLSRNSTSWSVHNLARD